MILCNARPGNSVERATLLFLLIVACTVAPSYCSAQADENTRLICNFWKNDRFIHMEKRALEASTIEPGWLSACWSFEPVANTSAFRLRNRWTNEYIHVQQGPLRVDAIAAGNQSSWWVFEKVMVGQATAFRIRNYWRNNSFLHIQNDDLAAGVIEQGWHSALWTLQSRPSTSAMLVDFTAYKQPDDISCGPTACQMVLKWYGIEAGIEPLKNRASTQWVAASVLGKRVRVGLTLPGKMKDALRSYGLHSTVLKDQTINDIKRYINDKRPPILLVRSGKETWHYVVAIGYDGECIRFADPADGERYRWQISKVNPSWDFSGDWNGNRQTTGSSKLYRKAVELHTDGNTVIVPNRTGPGELKFLD